MRVNMNPSPSVLSGVMLPLLLLLLLLLGDCTDAKVNIIGKQDVMVGDQVLLLCKVGSEGTLTWKKDDEDMDVLNKDESTSQLIITNASMEDAGRYTCQCKYETGHEEETHVQLFIYEGPSFSHTPTYHEFLEGTDGLVPCSAVGLPAVDVSWLRNKEKVPREAGHRVLQRSDNSIFIEKVRKEDAGTYTCRAQIRGRTASPIFKDLPISVVVNVPPTVHLKEEVKRVMAGPDNNVTLLCLVEGQPKPNITWNLPVPYDPTHHHFDLYKNELTIRSVVRADLGEYICTATNKIADSSATILLQVFEAPEVFVSAEQQTVLLGHRVSVSCNVSGHPQPELHWLKKYSENQLDSKTGRVHVSDGVFTIDDAVPSDGGLYSCVAVSSSGNASRDVAIHTQPGTPHYLVVSSGPTSVLFSFKTPPISGGTPITSYLMQWRESDADEWEQQTLPASDLLAVTSLKPYTLYTVRLAAVNAVGAGQFSDTNTVRTMGKGEPDSPLLVLDEMKVEANSFSVPLRQIDNGGSPVQHFNIRFKQEKDGSEWTDKQLPSNTDSLSLQELSFGSDYQLEVRAVNANGTSLPATFNFTIAAQPERSRMTKGSVVGIVMVIFLLVFLVVDATCCYRNRCGLLMTIAVKLFGQKVPGIKALEDGEGTTNGDVNLKGMCTPRGSVQPAGVQTSTKEGGQLTEVTCDKAPLTKHEKTQPDRNHPTTVA